MLKKVIIAIVVLVLGVLIIKHYLVPNAPINQGNNATTTQSQTGLTEYVDSGNGFSFNYPEVMTVGTSKTFLPGPVSEAVPATTFTRSIPIIHYELSGAEQPTTKNPEISVAVVQSTVADLAKDFADYEPVGNKTIGGKSFSIFKAGVEGEGLYYYLTSLNASTTLLFTQNFIDENNVISYQNAKDFLSLADQQKYAETILASLNIQ